MRDKAEWNRNEIKKEGEEGEATGRVSWGSCHISLEMFQMMVFICCNSIVMRFFGSQGLYIQLKVFFYYHLFIIYLLITFGGIIVCCVWCIPFIVLCFCMLSLGLCMSIYIWIVYMITCTEVWVNQMCCYYLSEYRHTYNIYYYICKYTNYTLHYITIHTDIHTNIHKVIRSLIHIMVWTWFQ